MAKKGNKPKPVKPLKIRLFEKHRNGATIDLTGEAERIVDIIIDWRKYNDLASNPKNTLGFKRNEDQNA